MIVIMIFLCMEGCDFVKTYGYCRISTPKQNIERQVRNILRNYPDAILYEDTYTGVKLARPQFQKLLKEVETGDVIVFDEVSRMSRDAEEGFELYKELYDKGVELVFLKEPHINTQTYRRALQSQVSMTGDKVDYILHGVNQYLMELAKDQIRIAFEQAQKEIDYLHQRTREGIETARKNGKQIGRTTGSKVVTKRSVEGKQAILKYSKDFGGVLKDKEIIQMLRCSQKSYYIWKKQLREEYAEE